MKPVNFSDPLARGDTFWRGVVDLHGDEWHRITFGDDDAMVFPILLTLLCGLTLIFLS